MENEMYFIKRAKKDVQAFDYLYEKYFPIINNFVYHRVYDDAIRQEIVSNVFFKAMRKIDKFKILDSKKCNFSAWLYRIAINETHQFFRDNKRKEKISTALKWNYVPDSDDGDDFPITFETLHEKMQQLSEDEQNLLSLRFFEKLKYKDIAMIYKKKETTIKVRIHRIINKLRKSLEGEIYEAI